jgi:hypothetical protein
VVLNACYSEGQAQAIAEHTDCVVGMSDAIGDQAAIRFAASFYQALGYGRDVKTAFDLGCNQIDLEHLGDKDVPQLLATKRRPSEIFLASTKKETAIGSLPEGQLSEPVADATNTRTRSGGVSIGNVSGDVKDNIIAGGDVMDAKVGGTTIFDQRGQQVNYQYNAAGDINFADVQNRRDVVEQLEKLQAEIKKAVAGNVLDEETATDVEYKLTKAVQQAKKPEPDKKFIMDYLSEAKELIAGITTGATTVGGLVSAFNQAIELVLKLF